MSFDAICVFLYPLVPIIAIGGYLPQIYKIAKSKTSMGSVSLMTWLIWFCAWGISLGYGVFSLQDFMFSLCCLVNMTAHVAIISLVAYKRRLYGSCLKINARIDEDINNIAHECHDKADQRVDIQRPQNDRVITVNYALISQ